MRKQTKHRLLTLKSQINRMIPVSIVASLLLLTGCITPLMDATRRGDIQAVKALLDQGSNVNEILLHPQNKRCTPLMAAAEIGNVEMVKLLIAKGADVNVRMGYDYALTFAAENGHTEVMDLLMDNGADMDLAIKTLEEYTQIVPASGYEQRVVNQLKQHQKNFAGRKGWTCYSTGEFEKGINAFRQAVQQNPADAVSFSGLAACYDSLGQYDEAVTAAKQAIALSPQSALGHLRLGQAYCHQNRQGEGERELKLAIDLDPKDPNLYRPLIMFYFETAQYPEALALGNKLGGILPPNSPLKSSVLQGVLACHYALGKYDEAIAAADQLVDLSTINGLGLTLNKQERKPPQITGFISFQAEGLEIGDYINKIDGKITSGMDLPTVVERLRGPADTEVQLTICRKGLKPVNMGLRRKTFIALDAALGYAVKSLAYREKADCKQADEYAKKAVELNAAKEESQLAAGVVALDKEQFAEAIRILSPYPTNNIFLATAYAKHGQFDVAVKLYLDYCDDVKLQKSIPGAKARKAFLLAMQPYTTKLIENAKQLEGSQQLGLALAELTKVLTVVDDERVEDVRSKIFSLAQRCQPKESDAAYRYSKRGDILLAEGNFNGAIAEYNRALRLAPYSPRLYFNAALIHGSLKNYTLAIQYMKTYVQFVPNAPNIQAAKDALIEWELKMEKR